jgi:hypothetical protein
LASGGLYRFTSPEARELEITRLVNELTQRIEAEEQYPEGSQWAIDEQTKRKAKLQQILTGKDEMLAAAERAVELQAQLDAKEIKPIPTNPGFKITDAMRETAREGFPLFQEKRGAIQIESEGGLPVSALISVFESGNFTTLIHEMGHYWLEDLRARALRDNALPQEKADYQAVVDWFNSLGVEMQWGDAIPVKGHEFWARGVERHTMEGGWAHPELRAVIMKMMQWMKAIYRTVSALNAPITPEIRDVMNRLIASDEEIAEARAELKLEPLKAKPEFMSDMEWAQYQKVASDGRDEAYESLLERVMKTLRASRTRTYNEEKRRIKASVAEEVDSLPVHQALKILREGVPDPENEGEQLRIRLDTGWLTDIYGEDAPSRLPKWIQPLHEEGGYDPEWIAEQAGFDSADQMVTALFEYAEAREELKASGDRRTLRQKMLDDAAEQQIADELGDPFENLEEEAQAAIANDKTADLMSLEIRALGRKVGRPPTPWQMARAWAKGHIAKSRSRDAITGSAMQRYARTVAKAGKAAEEALIKSDFEEAFRQKEVQLVNMALLAEAKKAKDEVEKAVKRLQRIAKAKTIRSVDQDYLDQAHQLLEAVDMKDRPLTQVDKRRSFEAWYAEQIAAGKDPIVPPEYQRILGQINWQQLPVDGLLTLDDAVQQIINLGRLKQELRDGQERRNREELVQEGVLQLQSLPQRKQSPLMDEKVSLWFRAKSALRSADVAFLKIEKLTDFFDGGDPNGIFNRMVFRKIADAQSRSTRMTLDYVNAFNALSAAMPPKAQRRWGRLVDTPELLDRKTGQPWVLQHQQVVVMALNWGNEGNRQRLLDGYNWSPEAVEAVFDRLMTVEDWEFVQGVWDTIDQLFPELAEMERRVNGVAPEKIEATPVTNRHGTFRGGYFPAVYDPDKSDIAERHNSDSLFAPPHQRANTRSGASHERVNNVTRPILIKMSVLTNHVADVIHDITHREAIMEVDSFISDKRIKAAISDAFGPEYANMFRPWLQFVARQGAPNSHLPEAVEKAARAMRTRTTMLGMGYRVMTALIQLLGYNNIIAEVGSARMMVAVATMIVRPRKTHNFMIERSGEMLARRKNVDRDLREHITRMAEKKGLGKAFQEHAFSMIQFMDGVVVTAGWNAAYDHAIAGKVRDQKGNLLPPMTEDEAIYYADKIIRLSQGSGAPKDQAQMAMHGDTLKLFDMFGSYLSSLYSQNRDIARRYKTADSFRGYYEATRRLFWITLLIPVLEAAARGEGPEEDDDEDGRLDEIGLWLLQKITYGNIGSIPGIREIAGFLDKGFGYKVSPIARVVEDIEKSAKDAWKLLDMDEETEESDSVVKNILSGLGAAFKLPLGQIGATAEFAKDVYTGEAEPETASDWFYGITRGKIPEEEEQ